MYSCGESINAFNWCKCILRWPTVPQSQLSKKFLHPYLAACSWEEVYTGPQNHFLMSCHSLRLQSAPWPALECGLWNGECHTTQGWTLQRINQVGKCTLTSDFLNIKEPAILSIQPLTLWISFTAKSVQIISCTIVLDVSGLLLGMVQRNTMNLHSNERIHYRVFFDIDFGQLLTTNHLKYINAMSEATYKLVK